MPPVSSSVRADFGNPVWGVMASGELLDTPSKVTTVPEVAVTEDCHTAAREHYVRPAWQIRNIDAIAEAPLPQRAPQQNLAPRVALATYGPSNFRCSLRRCAETSVSWGRVSLPSDFGHCVTDLPTVTCYVSSPR
jgi:hypothetical protein